MKKVTINRKDMLYDMIFLLTVNFPSSRTQECRVSDSLKCCKKWCVVGVEGRKGWAAGTADKISFK